MALLVRALVTDPRGGARRGDLPVWASPSASRGRGDPAREPERHGVVPRGGRLLGRATSSSRASRSAGRGARPLAFLWEHGSFAPAVTGTAVIEDGSGDIAQILGVDPGGDGAVREMKLLAGSGRVDFLAAPNSVYVPETFARRHRLSAGKTLDIVAGGARHTVTVVALLELSGVARAAGSDLLVTDIFTAQKPPRQGGLDRPGGHRARSASRARRSSRGPWRPRPGLTLQPPGHRPRPPTGWCAPSAST